VGAIGGLKILERACDSHREFDNLFYTLRADGFFEHIHTRAMRVVIEGTGLAAATQTEPEFRFEGVEGTLVCIWSPKYSSSFSVPGYHFHFISKDRTKGGHVLDCAARTLHIAIQTLSEHDVRLPEAGSFLKTNLVSRPVNTFT